MKAIIVLLFASAIISCKNKDASSTSSTERDRRSSSTNYIYNRLLDSVEKRDLTIDPTNSYSDLFVDSSNLHQFIANNKFSEEEGRAFLNFYNRRNYQFAWLSSDGLTEQGRGFWNLYTYDNDSAGKRSMNKMLRAKMDTLTEKDSFNLSAHDSSLINTELSLTKEFIAYLKDNPHKVFNNTADIDQYIPARKRDVLLWAESVLNRKDSISGAQIPAAYSQLKRYLERYYTIAKQGGWPRLEGSFNLRKGTNSASIVTIKKRLQLSGDLTGNDTTGIYNDSLESVIRSYQQRHGQQPSGIISDSLVRTLNIPIEQRIEQILVNMNRMLWMPAPDSNQVVVNIPAFELVVYEGNKKVFDMDVIVGREGWNTMMFNGDLNQIVFSPSWNVPPSIVRDEILPAMKRDKNYLKKKNMEVVKQSDSLPVIRQLPGADNALGRVKFLFPNSYDIYLHDTDAKYLFNRANRAISHGCIRLADAEKMATYLLRDDASWTPEKIRTAMNSGKEQFVKMKRSVPVAITYFTVWVDENGKLNFYDDVYGNDQKTASKMFTGRNWI